MNPTHASAIATAFAITAFVTIVAFNMGRIDGASARLRGNCGLEKIEHLKAGFYTELRK